MAGQSQVLEMIAQGAILPAVLASIAQLVESQGQDLYCSFALVDEDGQRLHLGAAPSFPERYWEEIGSISVAPATGPCGAAVYWKASIIADDIRTDFRWPHLREVALNYGLRACWSTPILSMEGQPLATFAIYHPYPRRPTQHHGYLISQATHLARVAIEKHRAEVKAQRAAQALEDANNVLELRVAERTRELSALVGRLHQEINERKQAEAALRQSEATNRALIAAIPDMLIRTRNDGTYLNILGRDRFTVHNNEQFLENTNVYDSLPPQLAQARMQHIHNALETGEVQRYEQRFNTNGQVQDEEVRVVVSGEDEVLIIVRDITNLKQVENALYQSEVRNRALINALPDLMIRMSRDGVYLDFIPAKSFRHILGGLDVIGKKVFDVLPPALAQQRMEYVEKALQTGETQVYEHQFLVAGELQAEETRIAVCGEDEVLVIVRDISDRKRVEEKERQKALALEQALRELQLTQTQLIQTEKMSSLGQLVAGVAHEINNPVNFIYGNIVYMNDYVDNLLKLVSYYQQSYPQPAPLVANYLKDIDFGFLQEDLPKTLTSMKVGADRIRQIVLSLRNFSRLEESAMKPVDIHEGLDSTLLILQHRFRPQFTLTGIQLVKEYAELPKVECLAGQINQVFMNILVNALDALDEAYERSVDQPAIHPGEVRIRTEVSRDGWVAIRIADNGPGMSEEIRSHIFDPFYTTKPVGKGTGLGLSISYQIIVEKHKGTLHCVSIPEQGTEFIIEIPICATAS
ncbi:MULTISPECIES: ATP-binding protein [unclassified Leptolyngbya]|uniref:ATP-binding protein n=1 Tax=unclassified Leptolyngbya TaxID=2650499 RepID=UPI001681C86F|nr:MULTISPECIES: ATP-binding protein [unclassified Leptolyngbya]MBD1909870.1 PAS domain-containing protein [Leptolyngbya sp. FACHB-8]MBD2156966.1 PAS domain-containing protein [Leptolyngbya sp. FACHB-16]